MEKFAFICLLWVNKSQINYPMSRNPWQVIILGPVSCGSCQNVSRLQVSGVDGAVGEGGQDALVVLVRVEGQEDARRPPQEVEWAGHVVVIRIWGNVIMNGDLSSRLAM